MKRTILLIALLSLFSCRQDLPTIIQQDWMLTDITPSIGIDYGGVWIYSFGQNKQTIKSWSYFSPIDTLRTYEYDCQLLDSTLIVEYPQWQDKLTVRVLSNNKIQLIREPPYARVFTLERLQKYELADKKEELKKRLTGNTFSLELTDKDKLVDSLELEFISPEKFLTGRQEPSLAERQFWRIETYLGELFLLTDGDAGLRIHIQEIKENEIVARGYSQDHQRFVLKEIQPSKKYHKQDLIGKWVQDDAFQEAGFNTDKTENLETKKETLIISDSTIQQFVDSKNYQYQWSLNSAGEKLYFPNSVWQYPNGWHILYLTDNELIVDRGGKLIDNEKYGEIKFARKE